jgi:hypothetical protein
MTSLPKWRIYYLLIIFDYFLWFFVIYRTVISANSFSTFSEIVSRNLQISWNVSGKYIKIEEKFDLSIGKRISAIHRFLWNSGEHRESLRDNRPSQGPAWSGFTSLEGLISAHRWKQALRRSVRFARERCLPFSRFRMVRLHEFDWTHQCLTRLSSLFVLLA